MLTSRGDTARYRFIETTNMGFTMFQVIGIDTEDGSATVLQDFTNSAEARTWFQRYVGRENAGNWPRVEVLDTRSECAETLWWWSSENQD